MPNKCLTSTGSDDNYPSMSLALGLRGSLSHLGGNRGFVLLLGAALVSQMGDWALSTGIAFQVYALTGSTVTSAAVLIATQLPQALFGSPAGLFVDRHDPRLVMVVVNLGLSATVLPLIAVKDAGHVWLVVLVTVVSSCLTPFFLAAEASLLPAIVPSALLPTANALNGQVRNVARLVGAALGGLGVGAGGLPLLAIADFVTFVAAAVLISTIRSGRRARVVAASHPLRELKYGLTAIRQSRSLRVLVAFFALAALGEAIMGTLFAPFVRELLGGTARDYGAILAAQALGAIAAGAIVAAIAHRVPVRVLFGAGAVAFGLLDLLLFLYPLATPAVWPAVLIIAAVGIPGAALAAGQITLFQLATSDHYRGRVFGVLATVENSVMLAGSAVAGIAAQALGILPVIVVQGIVYVLGGIMVLIALRPRAVALPAPS